MSERKFCKLRIQLKVSLDRFSALKLTVIQGTTRRSRVPVGDADYSELWELWSCCERDKDAQGLKLDERKNDKEALLLQLQASTLENKQLLDQVVLLNSRVLESDARALLSDAKILALEEKVTWMLKVWYGVHVRNFFDYLLTLMEDGTLHLRKNGDEPEIPFLKWARMVELKTFIIHTTGEDILGARTIEMPGQVIRSRGRLSVWHGISCMGRP